MQTLAYLIKNYNHAIVGQSTFVFFSECSLSSDQAKCKYIALILSRVIVSACDLRSATTHLVHLLRSEQVCTII